MVYNALFLLEVSNCISCPQRLQGADNVQNAERGEHSCTADLFKRHEERKENWSVEKKFQSIVNSDS